MSLEGQLRDQKSLRAITGKTADWAKLVKDCIACANPLGPERHPSRPTPYHGWTFHLAQA